MSSLSTFQRLQRAASEQGIDLSVFRPEFLARRLKRSAILAGELFLDREVDRLIEDPAALTRFLEGLSIGVSAFFRDRLPYALLEDRVLPRLRRTFPTVHAWSAACAQGHEPWSLAMMLWEQRISSRVWASDRNPAFVETAQAGVYAERELAQLSRERYQTFFSPLDAQHASLRPLVRGAVQFAVHDLAHGVLPAAAERPLHLVLCRNVLIYLGTEARRRLCLEIARHLAPGGYLLLGSAEHLPEEVPLTPVDQEARLYRRDDA